jgi:hypothetical protein
MTDNGKRRKANNNARIVNGMRRKKLYNEKINGTKRFNHSVSGLNNTFRYEQMVSR